MTSIIKTTEERDVQYTCANVSKMRLGHSADIYKRDVVI